MASTPQPSAPINKQHKRRVTCVLCLTVFEYIWFDQEAWVQKITCSRCRDLQKKKDAV